MDDEEAGSSNEEVDTYAGEVDTGDEEVVTDDEEVETDAEDVCTDDDDEGGTVTVTVAKMVDEASAAVLEDSEVTRLDTVGVLERVQFLTSTTLSSIGTREMIQVCVTGPIGLEKEKLVIAINPGRPKHTN